MIKQVLGFAGGLLAINAILGGRKAVEGMPLPELGKSTDTAPIKEGSRVNEYWNREGIKERDFTGRKKRYTVYTANAGEIVERYGLHSIEFGNYVPQDERQQILVGLDEALGDLANIFRVPFKKIGLKGSLAIAYGARGRGTALATYWPGYILINLVRNKGIGSLAHEYGHALDFHLGRKRIIPSGGSSLRTNYAPKNPKSPFGVMEKALAKLMLDNGKVNAWRKGISKMPKYWIRREEIWARSFETLIQSELKKKGLTNTLLTHSSYRSRVYPTPALIAKARPEMMKFSRLSLNY